MINLSITDSGALGILTLGGNLAEHPRGELNVFLTQALGHVSRVIVNCEKVTAVDGPSLRALCAAYRTARLRKKDFALAGSCSAAFRGPETTAGLKACRAEHAECGQGCMWSRE